ncbi:hypothetical protein Trydic_g21452 [Trypoxylus dichotomus]
MIIFRSDSSNMAETESVAGAVSKSTDEVPENTVYDPTLDFFSDKFDPLKALSTPGLRPPVLGARAFDNLSVYESAHKQKSADSDGGKTKQQGTAKQAAAAVPFERRWLPHQLLIPGKKKKRNDVLTRMENATGPLKLLKKCMDEKLLVKVWTRNASEVRGYCTGYVTAFDKHWNLSLKEVTEVWTRKKKRKIPLLDENVGPPMRNSRNTIKLPEVTVIKSDKKTETCQRCIPQLMVRGEQIVLISVVQMT